MPPEAPVTEEMILRHWELEKELTKKLLSSKPEDRWDTFEKCYSTLYGELTWLNDFAGTDSRADDAFEDWTYFLGPPPKTVFEVGSGKGDLVRFLAESGYRCKGSEVTKERGERWAGTHPNLQWGVTDGVHLEEFEPEGSYDAVISDQVIEHLHPDDLVAHFEGAFKILRSKGRYVFSTPHRHYGPMDVSRVFGYDSPKGMHLKEYTYRELLGAAGKAGFTRFAAPVRVPRRVRRLLGGRPHPFNSSVYLRYLLVLESLLGLFPSQKLRRRIARASRILLFDGVLLTAQKP